MIEEKTGLVASLGEASLHEMVAEQPALAGILEGMALGELTGAELWD